MATRLPNHQELWPTAVHLAPTIAVRDTVLAAVVNEARTTYDAEYAEHATRRYGWAVAKALRILAQTSDDNEATVTVARAMCEALQTTGATRTGLGRVVTGCATRLVWGRQGLQPFRGEADDVVVRDAKRVAELIASELPAFARMVSLIVRKSAAALRERAAREHQGTVHLFRGVRAAEAPVSLGGRRRHLPDASSRVLVDEP